MGLEFLTDEHLGKIVRAAILLDEKGVEPTEDLIEDEEVVHLPEIVASLAATRWLSWTTAEEGNYFLEVERGLDKEQIDAPYDVREQVTELLRGAAWSFKNGGHGPFDPSWVRWHKVTGAQCRAMHYAIGAIIERQLDNYDLECEEGDK